MGSNQFQREYIEYLQERNSELLKKLTHMKENYENKIFSKDLNKHYLMTALEDVLKVCTVLPTEIDSFFEKMTGAMDVLKNILIKKSEMVQLTEKITQAMNPTGNAKENFIDIDGPGFLREPNFDSKMEKKGGGTVKVSPMINGHVISTAPKIYLSRIPENLTPDRSDPQLSPIVEVSSNTSLDASGLGQTPKELRIPLERINFNKPPYNFINMDSPKSRFKGLKEWKESLMTNKQQADKQKNETCMEEVENLNGKQESVCNDKAKENEEDPLEGPSWLYDKSSHCNKPFRSPEFHAFVDCRPRKYRFAGVFDTNAELTESLQEGRLMHTEMDTKSRRRKTKAEKINETPEDLVRETSVEDEENDAPSEKKLNSTYRKYIEETSDENGFSEFEADTKKKASTPYSKIPGKSEYVYEADCEENPSAKKSVNKSYRKRRSRSLFDENSVKPSLGIQTTPESFRETEHVKEENPRIPEKRNAKNSEPKSVKEENVGREVFVKVSDCRASKKVQVQVKSSKRSKTMSPEEGKKTSTSGRDESGVPEAVYPENQGRKRRKAAPKNLREPSLNRKCRRE